MSGPYPSFLAVVVVDDNRLCLATNIARNDDFFGKMEAGDRLLAVSTFRETTGLVKELCSSGDRLFLSESDREGVSLPAAFEKVVIELVRQAYEAGRSCAVGHLPR